MTDTSIAVPEWGLKLPSGTVVEIRRIPVLRLEEAQRRAAAAGVSVPWTAFYTPGAYPRAALILYRMLCEDHGETFDVADDELTGDQFLELVVAIEDDLPTSFDGGGLPLEEEPTQISTD